MFPTLCLSAIAGVCLPTELIDVLVSKRVVLVERQVRLDVGVYTGDPLGSRENKTLKTVAEPCLMTTHKCPAMFLAGGKLGEVPVGIQVKATPHLRLDGKVYLDCELTESTANTGRGVTTTEGFVPGVDSKTIRVAALLTPGKRLKIRISSRSATDQTWIEIESSVIEPTGTPKPVSVAPELVKPEVVAPQPASRSSK